METETTKRDKVIALWAELIKALQTQAVANPERVFGRKTIVWNLMCGEIGLEGFPGTEEIERKLREVLDDPGVANEEVLVRSDLG